MLKQAAEEQDRRYFHAHPEADSYDRPATGEELRATGLAFGTMVHVTAVSTNLRIRAFYAQDARQN
jgi:hypothetical protein